MQNEEYYKADDVMSEILNALKVADMFTIAEVYNVLHETQIGVAEYGNEDDGAYMIIL